MGHGWTSFVALGDSFTEGLNDLGPDGIHIGWADRTAAVLAEQAPGFRYANLAVRGKLLRHVVSEQVPAAIAMEPELVSIAAGGNDILRRADVDDLADLFETGVTRLRQHGCQVMVVTGFDPRTTPVIRLLRGQIATYNMHLRAIADQHGCLLVDLWSMRALHDPRAWSPDRLHLTTDGHQRVALRALATLGVDTAGQAQWRTPLPAKPAGWLQARRADLSWAREYAAPWVRRRLRRTSTGDSIAPKRPELEPVP